MRVVHQAHTEDAGRALRRQGAERRPWFRHRLPSLFVSFTPLYCVWGAGMGVCVLRRRGWAEGSAWAAGAAWRRASTSTPFRLSPLLPSPPPPLSASPPSTLIPLSPLHPYPPLAPPPLSPSPPPPFSPSSPPPHRLHPSAPLTDGRPALTLPPPPPPPRRDGEEGGIKAGGGRGRAPSRRPPWPTRSPPRHTAASTTTRPPPPPRVRWTRPRLRAWCVACAPLPSARCSRSCRRVACGAWCTVTGRRRAGPCTGWRRICCMTCYRSTATPTLLPACVVARAPSCATRRGTCLRHHLNAAEDDALVFVGSGATAAANLLCSAVCRGNDERPWAVRVLAGPHEVGRQSEVDGRTTYMRCSTTATCYRGARRRPVSTLYPKAPMAASISSD